MTTKQTYIESEEDKQWLREVHGVTGQYAVAILYGNEDCPKRVETFAQDHYQCVPEVWTLEQGHLVRQWKEQAAQPQPPQGETRWKLEATGFRTEIANLKGIAEARRLEISRLQQERDSARAELAELKQWQERAVATEKRQLEAFQTERGVAMRAESERRKLERSLKEVNEGKLQLAKDLDSARAQVAELLNEISNLKHDYAIVSTERNNLRAAIAAVEKGQS